MNTNNEPDWRFEYEPYDEPPDETSYALRAYFDRMPDEKLRNYSDTWSDEEIVEWDGNFKADGDLMLPCAEREIEVEDYRKEITKCIEYRNRVRETLKNT